MKEAATAQGLKVFVQEAANFKVFDLSFNVSASDDGLQRAGSNRDSQIHWRGWSEHPRIRFRLDRYADESD